MKKKMIQHLTELGNYMMPTKHPRSMVHHNVDVELTTHKESHKHHQTSKVVHWSKSYIEHPSSIEVTLILQF